jgi:hypothetical protein
MEISNRAHLQTRLQAVFSTIDRGTSEPYFYTQQFGKEKTESLVAIFNNGIDLDPTYSGSIVGRIFLDSKNNLCFAARPLGKEEDHSWRTEILIPHVDCFEFEFLGKNSATEHGKKEKVRPINNEIAWRGRWPQSEGGIPSMIRLTIKENKQKAPLQFAFILPTPEPFVTYLEKKAL